ncbi:MAG: heavy metal-binding domain-containing protein [Opitutaceae bacterium]|nr:heavy metal-binding domain-containing protein [Opitutaceae bacterium]
MALLVPLTSSYAAEHGAHGQGGAAPAPKSAVEAWGHINGLREKLLRLVQEKNLKGVHDVTETLTAVLKALPGLSKDLPADKLKRAEGAVNNLVKALDAVHDDADEGDQALTEKHVKTVESLLKVLAAQFPADVAATAPIAVGTAHGDAGHTYYCSMHPDVTAAEPGATCPKCGGMKLVPKKA